MKIDYANWEIISKECMDCDLDLSVSDKIHYDKGHKVLVRKRLV